MHDATEAPTHLQTAGRAQVVILAVSFMGIAAAWTYSVLMMTCWVTLALVITILGAATTLSPVILLRLIFIILGLQVGFCCLAPGNRPWLAQAMELMLYSWLCSSLQLPP